VKLLSDLQSSNKAKKFKKGLSGLFAYGIFRVLYSPLEAFEEIVKKPTYKAPILVLILVLIITAGANCISTLEVFTPDEDKWAEPDSLWYSNGSVSFDSEDYVTGNYSVSSSASNATDICMRIKDIGPVNCTEIDGYTKIVFQIKWINQNGVPTSPNVALRLFSGEINSFEQDITGLVSNTSDQWAEVVLNVGANNKNWSGADPQNWENISGLEFWLTWPSKEKSITTKIDGVFFCGKYVPAIASEDFGYIIAGDLIGTGINFSLNWVIFAGTLFIVIKLYGGEARSFKFLFVVTGYVLSTLIVIGLIRVVLVLINLWSYILLLLISLAFHIWSIILYTIVIRKSHDFTWKSSATASVTAYFFGLMLVSLFFSF
jgi:hypothetical protein